MKDNIVDKNLTIKMILAQDTQCGIGFKGRLPWPPCRDDMRLFKTLTTGVGSNKNAVVMGYDTWASIPKKFKPLHNRMNIVLSVNHYDELLKEEGCSVFNSWDNLKKYLKVLKCSCEEVWIIGGSTIYHSALNNLHIDEVILTTFKNTYLCDCYFDVKNVLENNKVSYNTKLIKESDSYKMEVLTINN